MLPKTGSFQLKVLSQREEALIYLNIAGSRHYCHMVGPPDKWHPGWPDNQKHKTTKVPTRSPGISWSFVTYRSDHDSSLEAHRGSPTEPPVFSMNVNQMATHPKVTLVWLPFLEHLQWLADQALVLTPVSFVKTHSVRMTNQEEYFALFLNITYAIQSGSKHGNIGFMKIKGCRD